MQNYNERYIFKRKEEYQFFLKKFVLKNFQNRTIKENIVYLKANWKLLFLIKYKKLRSFKFFFKFKTKNLGYFFPNTEGIPYENIGPTFIDIKEKFLLKLLELLITKLNISGELRILDVGAHLGESFLQTIISCREHNLILNYTGFEPNFDSFYFLKNFVKTNTNSKDKNELFNIALSNKNKTGKIFYKEDFSAASKLKESTFSSSTRSSNISCYKLDDIENIKYSKNFIFKIDVERHEYELFEGGIEILKEYRPIVILEILNSECEEDFQKDSERKSYIYELFSNLNYEIYQVQNKSLKKVPITFKKIKSFPTNLLFWESFPEGELNDYVLLPKELEIAL